MVRSGFALMRSQFSITGFRRFLVSLKPLNSTRPKRGLGLSGATIGGSDWSLVGHYLSGGST